MENEKINILDLILNLTGWGIIVFILTFMFIGSIHAKYGIDPTPFKEAVKGNITEVFAPALGKVFGETLPSYGAQYPAFYYLYYFVVALIIFSIISNIYRYFKQKYIEKKQKLQGGEDAR